MAGMVILDKARALDRVVSLAIRIVVPDGLSRSAPAAYDTGASLRSATPLMFHAVASWQAEAVGSVQPAAQGSAARAAVPVVE
jgi:hypothetical protein